MKLHYIIGFLCITMIIVTGLLMGYDGVLAGAGVSAIVGILTWEAKKQVDKSGGNVDAVKAALVKLGYKEKFVNTVTTKMKGGKV